MKKLARVLAMAAILGMALVGNSALAATECNGPPTSASFTSGVVVKAGDFCFLAGATVYGGVRVNPGGLLITCGSTINGGIVANGALNLLIGAGADEEGPPINFPCPGNVINGGVEFSNTGPGVLEGPPSISLERNAIAGAVHLTGNQGAIVVSSNTIAGVLSCKNNGSDLDDEGTPSVITGGTNCEFGE